MRSDEMVPDTEGLVRVAICHQPFPRANVSLSQLDTPKMVYRGGCVAEYLKRSPSTYDEQIGVA